MEIQWFGTASISIKTDNQKILFDPFVPLKGSKTPIKIKDFLNYDQIFITHGHFDHIGSLKKIYKKNKRIKIYCTETPYNFLNKKGIPLENLVKIKPNDLINLDKFKVKVYQSKHIEYDPNAIKKIVLNIKSYKYIYNAPYIIYKHNTSKENGEILFYDVEVENKHIFLMGSLNYDQMINYPTNCDLFVMPYQGKVDLVTPALEIINILKPKCILLDHFDNTFPPVSKTVHTNDIEKALQNIIPVIKPEYKKVYRV